MRSGPRHHHTMSRRYLDIAVHPEQDEEVVGLGELLVHVADEEDAALAAAAPGVFPQRGLGDGLGLHLGRASSNTTCNSHFSSRCEVNHQQQHIGLLV